MSDPTIEERLTALRARRSADRAPIDSGTAPFVEDRRQREPQPAIADPSSVEGRLAALHARRQVSSEAAPFPDTNDPAYGAQDGYGVNTTYFEESPQGSAGVAPDQGRAGYDRAPYRAFERAFPGRNVGDLDFESSFRRSEHDDLPGGFEPTLAESPPILSLATTGDIEVGRAASWAGSWTDRLNFDWSGARFVAGGASVISFASMVVAMGPLLAVAETTVADGAEGVNLEGGEALPNPPAVEIAVNGATQAPTPENADPGTGAVTAAPVEAAAPVTPPVEGSTGSSAPSAETVATTAPAGTQGTTAATSTPTTAAPGSTAAPSTAAPTTAAPGSTAPPTTAAPGSTAAPTTVAPTTAAPTTAPPTTAPPTTAAPTTAPPTSEGSG